MGVDNEIKDFDENFFREIDKAVQSREERRGNHPNPSSGDYQVNGASGYMQLKKPLVNQEVVGQNVGRSLIQMKSCQPSNRQNLCAYRWAAESISVHDGLKAPAEIVGKGELMIRVRPHTDGTLGIVNAIIKADRGESAMDIPREAITHLKYGGHERFITPAAVANEHNVVLLGLGVGCTLVLSGVVPIESNDIQIDGDGGSSEEQAAVVEGIAAAAGDEGHTPLPAVTPKRRQLAPTDSATSSPLYISGNSGEILEMAVKVGGVAVNDFGMMPSTRRGFDPVLAKLIHDNSDPTVVSEDGFLGTPMAAGRDLQPAICESGVNHLELGETRGTKSPKGLRASVTSEKNVTPTLPKMREKKSSNGELHNEVEDRGDGNNRDGIVRSRIDRRRTDLKEDIDVPDEEWRRPLAVSPLGNRRVISRRRRPRVRDVSKSCGPVVLHLDLARDVVEEVAGNDPRLERVSDLSETGRRAKKRSLETGAGQVNASSIVELSPMQSPLRRRREASKMERTWLTLRKTLHERYRYLEETQAAEQTASEAKGGSVSRGSGWVGEELFPGLRAFPRQEHAFAYADALAKRLLPEDAARYKVLSFETSLAGKRRFIVCDIKRFEELYPYTAQLDGDLLQVTKAPRPQSPTSPDLVSGADDLSPGYTGTMPALPASENLGPTSKNQPRTATYPPLRHVYEIIREGSPCRMYFDLEFTRAHNPGLDGEWLVRSWINVVAGKIYQDFGISVGGCNILDLDSSTPKKFSRHLILHLPGDQLFEDNSHIGRFVNDLAADLETWKPASQPLPSPHTDEHGASSAVSGASSPLKCATIETPGRDGAVSDDSLARTGTARPLVTLHSPETGAPNRGRYLPEPSAVTPDPGSGPRTVGGNPVGSSTPDDRGLQASGEVQEAAIEGSGALESLWVRDGDGRRVLFADVSVYTRNRCFRLVGSSKYGRSAILQVANSSQRTLRHIMGCEEGQSRRPRDVARRILHDSLVVPANLRLKSQETFLTVGGEGAHRFSRFGKTQRLRPGGNVPRQGATFGKNPPEGCSSGDGDSCQEGTSAGWRIASSGFESSPFPAIDAILRTLIREGGVQGHLRQWNYTAYEIPGGDSEGEASLVQKVRKLTHQVSNNRWCWNIRRAHKSNHIFLVTDLSRGEVRQHCHDQECRRLGYRSKRFRLPPNVVPTPDDLEAYELELGLAAAMRESPADWISLS